MPDRMFRFASAVDGLPIQAYAWETTDPRAVVVVAHGAAEHALRYHRFARALNVAGIDVWAQDHRGHGQSAGPEGLGDFGDGGWDALVADIGQLIGIAQRERPAAPMVLLGHSMGAAAAQQFAPDGSDGIDALVLSGSTAREAPKAGEVPPAFEPNKPFEPARTPYDWLSRDETEVDKYIADPFAGSRPNRSAGPTCRCCLWRGTRTRSTTAWQGCGCWSAAGGRRGSGESTRSSTREAATRC